MHLLSIISSWLVISLFLNIPLYHTMITSLLTAIVAARAVTAAAITRHEGHDEDSSALLIPQNLTGFMYPTSDATAPTLIESFHSPSSDNTTRTIHMTTSIATTPLPGSSGSHGQYANVTSTGGQPPRIFSFLLKYFSICSSSNRSQ